MKSARSLPVLSLLLFAANSAWAGKADVTDVAVRCNPEKVCTFAVTIRHADAGWDHYANRFDILSTDGEVLGTRVLRHPHVNEQPFTRSLQGVKLPEGTQEVRVRAHDSVHGVGGQEKTVAIEP